MKQVVLSVALLALPFWLPSSEVFAGDEKKSAEGHVYVVTTGQSGEAKAWLGVSFEQVPEALSEQLNIEGRGFVVLNVVKDSPADEAGLQAHDIILSLNGKTVEGDLGRLPEMLSTFKPGDAVKVEMIRDGQRKNASVTLGSRPAEDSWEWRYNVEPQRVKERVMTRGRIMGKDKEGKWFMKDLGNLDHLKDLPHNIRVMMPEGGTRTMEVSIDAGSDAKRIKVRKDDETLEIVREGDGPIRVDRTDESGETNSATYATEDELKNADPEAYGLFAQSGKGHIFLNVDGADDEKDVIVEMEALGGDQGEWWTTVDESMREAREAFEQAKEEFANAHRDIAEQWKQFEIQLHHSGEPGSTVPMPRVKFLGRAQQTFHVMPDGKIEVRIRKGDSEVVRVFTNEADLSKRDPELFRKYQDVMTPEE